MNLRSRSRCHVSSPPSSSEAVKYKLWRIVSRHEQLKVAFHQLHSQIRAGLLEAEEVFASLALPLTKLVGLKTVEMASEGRLSTVVTSIDRSDSQKEENYMSKATTAGNELMERQKLQLIQLITLLKKIEAQVNASQNSIVQNLADHRAVIKRFFLKAFTYVSTVQESTRSNTDLSHMMLKILKATYDQVGVAFGSVEVGIDDMICELAEKMCNPMVDYVNGLKVEMKAGTCTRLLEVVKDMDGEMKVRKFELDEARKQARLAEESRVEALSKLLRSEDMARKLTASLGMLTDDNTTGLEENSTHKKSLSTKDDKGKEESLLWDLLGKKRKHQVSDSPLDMGTCSKKLKTTRVIPSPVCTRFSSRSSSNTPNNIQPPFTKSRMLLGLSPSPTTQNLRRSKRITP